MTAPCPQGKILELNDAQLAASLPYVCYERSMYHLLERGQRIRRFPWLLLDRPLHLVYVKGVNEAIQYFEDGFSDLQRSCEVEISGTPAEVAAEMASRFKEGWAAHTMMTTSRADGSTYVTSNLIEGIIGDEFLITKTNETMRAYCVPTPINEVMSRLPGADAGAVTVTMTQFPPEMLDLLRTCTDQEFLLTVFRDIYGYSALGDVLSRHGVPIRNECNALTSLHAFLSEMLAQDPERIQSDKGVQLMMNKHITNKIQPLLRAWNDALPAVTELAGDPFPDMSDGCVATAAALERLTTRFVLMVRKPNERTITHYLNALESLSHDFASWQTACRVPLTAIAGGL